MAVFIPRPPRIVVSWWIVDTVVILWPKPTAISIIFTMLEIIDGSVARNSEMLRAGWFSPTGLVSFLLSGNSELSFQQIGLPTAIADKPLASCAAAYSSYVLPLRVSCGS